jgi:Flp pilus assembly pilin Flp
VIGGASWGEIGFVALLVAIVLLAPVAPRLGGAIGGLFEKTPKG